MTGWKAGVRRPGGTVRPSEARREATTGRAPRIGEVGLALGSVLGMVLWAGSATAQGTPAPAPVEPPGSLVVNPQQGATPRPLPASPSLPPAPVAPVAPVFSPPATIGPVVAVPAAPPITSPGRSVPSASPTGPAGSPLRSLQGDARGLPAPSGDPLAIDPASDPILRLARTETSPETFRRAIAEAVRRNPAIDEINAQAEEADAVRREARERTLPTADLSISSFKVIDRAFSNDPRNILERSRPRERTDGLLRVQQPVVDFGASLNRIRASEARLEAARADVEDTAAQVALRAVSAWYSVYGYRVLIRLADAFGTSQQSLRASIKERVRQGAAAPADVAQVDSYIASADAQRADFRRLLVSAEAQYAAVIGAPPPADLARAPVPMLDGIAAGTLAADTDLLPAVRAARLGVDAAKRDAKALRADRLPQLSAGFDAGRYGIIETARDYDVRASLTLSMRLGGGAAARVGQADARVARADARLRRTRVDAQRDAEIALSDVQALEEARTALESNYIASRRSRDVLAERFRVARGTVFDLLGAQSNYFGVTARYIQSMIELDSARYALLARTGRLLPALGIAPAALETR